MKEFKITEEQIKENKDLTLKEYFKEVFETKLEVGKWYKNQYGALFCFQGYWDKSRIDSYGFGNAFLWTDSFGCCSSDSNTLATEEEVFNALKKEAEKRGYKVGSRVKCLKDGEIETINEINYDFWFDCNRLWIHGNCKIFDNGKWAEIISQPDQVIELNGVKYKRID